MPLIPEHIRSSVVILNTVEEIKAHLNIPAAGPTLHPRKDEPASPGRGPYRWNGWNTVAAGGCDATGSPLVVKRFLFANGYEDYTSSLDGDTQRGGRLAFDDVEFPVALFPAKFLNEHPEHTPEVTP